MAKLLQGMEMHQRLAWPAPDFTGRVRLGQSVCCWVTMGREGRDRVGAAAASPHIAFITQKEGAGAEKELLEPTGRKSHSC